MIKRLLKSAVVKNASWLMIGQIIQLGSSLIIGMISARYLGPSDYGLLSTGSAFMALLTPICTLGFTSTYVNEVKNNPDKENLITGTSIVFRLLSSIVAIMLLFIVSGLLYKWDRKIVFIIFMQSLSLLFQAFNIIEYWYQSRLQSKVSTIITTIAYLIISSYKIFLLATGKSVEWFACSIAIEYAIITVLYLFFYRIHGKKPLKVDFTIGVALLKNSYHYILSGLMVVLGTQISKPILSILLDSSSVGIYTAATNLSGLHGFILGAIITSLRPYIIDKRKESIFTYRARIKQMYSIIVWLGLAVFVFYILFSRFLINTIYGNGYESAVVPTIVLSLFVPFSYLGVARNVWSVCEGMQKYEKYIALCSAVSTIGLDFILIPLFGTTGAAIAVLISSLFSNVIFCGFVKEMRENFLMMVDALNPKYLFIDLFHIKERK